MDRTAAVIVTAVTVCVMGAAEYFLCRKSSGKAVRLIPALWPAFWACTAVYLAVQRPFSSAWLDLSGFFSLVCAVYALISVLGMLGGYLFFRSRNKA